MKSTGIVRKVDELGRVVIPMELRRVMDIKEKDPMEIYVDGEKIIFKKYQPYQQCMVTGEISERNIALANGKMVLSPEGARQVIEELQKYTQDKRISSL